MTLRQYSADVSDFQRHYGWAIALGVLVVINVLLVGMLVTRFRTEAPMSAVLSTAVPSVGSSGPGTKSRTPSPSPTTGAPVRHTRPTAGHQDRVLAADSEFVAWRAVSGGCDTPAIIEVTTDGGQTWQRTHPGIRAIVRLKAYGSESVFAIGADAHCQPTYAWIDGPGLGWQHDASQVADKWFRVPGDLDQVHDTFGGRSKPCGDGLADLAGLGTYQAAALCADGRIRTRDQGRGWRTVEEHSGAVALNADDIQFVAAVTSPGCTGGVAIRTFDVNGTGLPGGDDHCRKGPSQSGGVGVSNIWSSVWLWSGKKVSVGP